MRDEIPTIQLLTIPEERRSASHWSQGEITGMLGHDLISLLGVQSGFLGLLSGAPLDAHYRDCLETAIECSDELQSVLNGIIECAKIEVGKLAVHKKPTNLRELLQSVVHPFGWLAEKNGIALKVQVMKEVSELLPLDDVKLRQIVTNLLMNAIKFTKAGGISLWAGYVQQPDGAQFLELAIEDTGVGIAREQLTSVFDAYHQGEQNSERFWRGSGLGLAIVKKLVATLDGKLYIQSAPNVGTCIRICLPSNKT